MEAEPTVLSHILSTLCPVPSALPKVHFHRRSGAPSPCPPFLPDHTAYVMLLLYRKPSPALQVPSLTPLVFPLLQSLT